jgi:hypothetical protein
MIDVNKERDLKFYYPFTSSYWCPAKVDRRIEPQRDEEDQLINASLEVSSSMDTLQA